MNNTLFSLPLNRVSIETNHFDVDLLTYGKKKETSLNFLESIKPDLNKFLDHVKFAEQFEIKIDIEDEKPKDKDPDFKPEQHKGYNGYFKREDNGHTPSVDESSLWGTKNEIHISIYSVGSLVHEFGHVINYIGKLDVNDENHNLSEFTDFDPIYNSYVNNLTELSKGTHYSERTKQYIYSRDEAFAIGFNLYYNSCFRETQLTKREIRLVEQAMNKTIMDLGDEFYAYYDKNIPDIANAYQDEKRQSDEIGIKYAGWTKENGYAYKDLATNEVIYKDEYLDILDILAEKIQVNQIEQGVTHEW